jgi:hypothetical protein
MNQNKVPDSKAAGEADTLIDYVIHQYGLTRDEARDVVKQFGPSQAEVDAAAGRMRAQKRP